MIVGWGIPCKIALRWMSLALTDKSTLVQVMAWCHQATSHYRRQCWPRSLVSLGHNELIFWLLISDALVPYVTRSSGAMVLTTTVRCRYNTVQYHMLLHSATVTGAEHIKWHSQKTPDISPSWASYWVSFVRIWEKIDCIILIHWSLVMPFGDRKLGQHWVR